MKTAAIGREADPPDFLKALAKEQRGRGQATSRSAALTSGQRASERDRDFPRKATRNTRLPLRNGYRAAAEYRSHISTVNQR